MSGKKIKELEEKFSALSALLIGNKSPNDRYSWLLDSGSSLHVVNTKEEMINFEAINFGGIVVGNGVELKVEGRGSMMLRIDGVELFLKCVYFVPELSVNLLSVSELTDDNKSVIFERNSCSILLGNGQKILIDKLHKMYTVPLFAIELLIINYQLEFPEGLGTQKAGEACCLIGL